jgi:hypothetical protein
MNNQSIIKWSLSLILTFLVIFVSFFLGSKYHFSLPLITFFDLIGLRITDYFIFKK